MIHFFRFQALTRRSWIKLCPSITPSSPTHQSKITTPRIIITADSKFAKIQVFRFNLERFEIADITKVLTTSKHFIKFYLKHLKISPLRQSSGQEVPHAYVRFKRLISNFLFLIPLEMRKQSVSIKIFPFRISMTCISMN